VSWKREACKRAGEKEKEREVRDKKTAGKTRKSAQGEEEERRAAFRSSAATKGRAARDGRRPERELVRPAA
jgi:hypothetical protein